MLYRLLQRNDSRKYNPSVLSLMKPTSLKERFEALGVRLHTLAMRPPVPTPADAWKLRQILRKSRPDLIQGWMYHGNLAATAGAWLAGFTGPVIWNVRHSLHDLRHEKAVARAVIRLNARLSHQTRAIVYNAGASIAQHEAIGFAEDRSVLIPNGFDCKLYRPRPELRAAARAELGIAEHTPLIGMIARYHPMKDPVNLLDALAILMKTPIDPYLVIAGRHFDQDNQLVVKAIAARGLADRVRLLDRRDDVHRLLAALDVAVLPSAWGEGFPNAIGEAMAAGVPCVATDVGDSAALIGTHGEVVPPRDPQALAAALARTLSLDAEARKRIGQAARERILGQFEIGTIVQRYQELHDLFLDPASAAGAPPPMLDQLTSTRTIKA